MQFKYRQAIILRKDLKINKGKYIVHGAHVSVNAVLEAMRTHPEWVEAWLDEGFSKVALRVDSLEKLEELEKKAREFGLPTAKAADFGLTQVEPGTVIALAIGPGPIEVVRKVTGELKLF